MKIFLKENFKIAILLASCSTSPDHIRMAVVRHIRHRPVNISGVYIQLTSSAFIPQHYYSLNHKQPMSYRDRRSGGTNIIVSPSQVVPYTVSIVLSSCTVYHMPLQSFCQVVTQTICHRRIYSLQLSTSLYEIIIFT